MLSVASAACPARFPLSNPTSRTIRIALQNPDFLIRPQNRESRRPSFPVQRSRENRSERQRFLPAGSIDGASANRQATSRCLRKLPTSEGNHAANAISIAGFAALFIGFLLADWKTAMISD